MFAAFLDTCTLWPSLRRDVLLSFAAEGLYRPIWSSTVLDELFICEVDKLTSRGADPKDAEIRAIQLIQNMRVAFDDSEVPEATYKALEGSYGLPDPNDEHVVAAAVIGNAGAIVTENLKDFPIQLLPFGVDLTHPSEFLYDTVQIDPVGASRAIQRIVQRSGRFGPQLTFDDVLDQLRTRYGLDACVHLLSVGPRP